MTGHTPPSQPAHGGFVPHRHCPPEQTFDVPEHVLHVLPPVPQLVVDGVSHVVPLQQPVGQEMLSQVHDPLKQR
jgi:hypothetical protein